VSCCIGSAVIVGPFVSALLTLATTVGEE
jgi:hypothetical protein